MAEKFEEIAVVVDQSSLGNGIYDLTLKTDKIAKAAKAGQFVILRLDNMGERIPLTIADFNPFEGTVTVILQKVGLTTQLLSLLRPGDEILDVVGPLGRPTDLEGIKRAVVVGGGFIGLEMMENLTHQGVQVTVVEKQRQVMAPIDYDMACGVHAYLRDKGVALRALAEQLGIAREQVLARGDSGNDCAMLRYAGVGAAMGNAGEQAKKEADVIAPSNREDGVAWMLRRAARGEV